MKDEETGSIWQQISGKAIFGPLKGRNLSAVYCDELTFREWLKEEPLGRVLKPDPKFSGHYAKSDWEQRVGKLPVAAKPDRILPLREIIVGIQAGGMAKAYPLSRLSPEAPIVDQLGDTPILLCMAKDGKSVRCFDRRLDGAKLEFFAAKQPTEDVSLIDATTNSQWGFDGIARSGPLAGRQLSKIPAIKDYWFDWRNYHPTTLLYLH